MSLTFAEFQRINTKRNVAWENKERPWTLVDKSNELAGETGELCNIVKKLRRIECGMSQRDTEADAAALRKLAIREAADVVICAFLVAIALGVEDFGLEVTTKFNETSDKFGFPHKIEPN